MVIRSLLFSRNRGQTPDLHSVLEYQKQQLINRISVISSLDEMTDGFLTELVQNSLIRPITLARREDITREDRTEVFSGSDFPNQFDFDVPRGNRYPKTVFRISVPFTGDRNLFNHAPNQGDFNPPLGQVFGSEVQFDVVLWGYHDDAVRVGKQIAENLDRLERYTGYSNNQIRAHNASMSPIVTEAFKQKLEKLSGQHAIFDNLGIKEKPKAQPIPVYVPTASKPARKTRPKEQIVQYVQNIYVETIEKMEVATLNQTNNNGRDVNNAIQSGE